MATINKSRPRPDQARLLAFDLLTEVNRNFAYANIRLPQLLSESSLDTRDKAFVTELSYGTLRMQGKYDYAISQKSDRPFDSLDSKVVDLLRLGTHQIFGMRVPIHAAINETVEVARLVAGESGASFVNALLRSLGRDQQIFDTIESREDLSDLTKLSIIYSHPEWIISSYFQALKDWEQVISLLAANNVPAQPHLVAWPGKSTPEDLLRTGGSRLPETAYGVISTTQPSDYPEVNRRNAGVQDLGSQIVSEIFFNTRTFSASSEWLDMCAGPGGKAAWVYNALAQLEPEAHFLANEPTPHRAELVARVLPRSNITSIDGRRSQDFSHTFDRILVDAPCTGLGALRRRPEARWRKDHKDLKELVGLQRDLLFSAVSLLNPGGIMAYATCSPHVLETSAQVIELLHMDSSLKLLPVSDFHTLPGTSVKKDGTLQLWTHVHNSDSMFMALFHKSAG